MIRKKFGKDPPQRNRCSIQEDYLGNNPKI